MNERTTLIGPLLIRLMVGGVFVSEGIQKFLYADKLGAGRFESIGLPLPDVMGPVIGATELVAGALLLIGFITRPAAIAIFGVMTGAIVTTKIPILLGQGFLGLEVRELSRYGFWSMAHEMRTDWAMWLGALFLLLVGPGTRSIDAHRKAKARTRTVASKAGA